MQVLSVASECFPVVKTGGLADVAAALPRALETEGITVGSLLPGYPTVLSACDSFETIHAEQEFFGGPARIIAGRTAGLDLFVVDAPHLFCRAGGPYNDLSGRDWTDNAQRFAALSWAAAGLGQGLVPGFVPDVIHAHDWQAGLTPAYLFQTQ